MSEKHSISSPSLERADTLNGQGNAYDDHDVFGHEEEHDVRISILFSSELMPKIFDTAWDQNFSQNEGVG